jgi:transcription elongation factor Elf1
MQINRCPKCGKEPKMIAHPGILVARMEIRCDSCGLSTKQCISVTEAVAKWNEMTGAVK